MSWKAVLSCKIILAMKKWNSYQTSTTLKKKRSTKFIFFVYYHTRTWNQLIPINIAFYIKDIAGPQSFMASKSMNAGTNVSLCSAACRLSSRFVVPCWISRSVKKALCLLMTYSCEVCTRQLLHLIRARFIFNTDLNLQFSRKENGKISSPFYTLLSDIQQWSFSQHQEIQTLSFKK